MSIYERVKADLARYNPYWWRTMAVTDIATWLCSWYDSWDILSLYVDTYAERKAALNFNDLTYSVRLCQAAYVALDPDAVRRMALDEGFKELLATMVSERKSLRTSQREGAAQLAEVLKALLPRYPYNKRGGDNA